MKIKDVDYKENLQQFIDTQANSNQCMSTFLKELNQILGSRRRYLLLNKRDINSTSLTDEDENIKGYPWLEEEAENVY